MSRYAEEILKTVLDSKEHPTAEQVFMQMKRSYPKIAQATVYNNLNALTVQGKLIRLSEAERRTGSTTPHGMTISYAAYAASLRIFRLATLLL